MMELFQIEYLQKNVYFQKENLTMDYKEIYESVYETIDRVEHLI
jgi:hypothetical protein